MKGAHKAGCASFEFSGALSIMARIERRKASARPIEGSAAVARMRPVVSLTVASESTGQCETRIERAPA
jgi:hypothetical protein